MYAFNAKTGALIWKHNASGGISGSSPTVSGDIVYIGAEDNILYALEKSSGTLVWSFKADNTINSSPMVSDGFLYLASSDSTVYAFTNQALSATNAQSKALKTLSPQSERDARTGINVATQLRTTDEIASQNVLTDWAKWVLVVSAIGGLAVVVWRRRYHAT